MRSDSVDVSSVSSSITLSDSDKDYCQVLDICERTHETLSEENMAYSLIPLAVAAFDDPCFFSAFILWLFDREVSPLTLLESGLWQHFLFTIMCC